MFAGERPFHTRCRECNLYKKSNLCTSKRRNSLEHISAQRITHPLRELRRGDEALGVVVECLDSVVVAQHGLQKVAIVHFFSSDILGNSPTLAVAVASEQYGKRKSRGVTRYRRPSSAPRGSNACAGPLPTVGDWPPTQPRRKPVRVRHGPATVIRPDEGRGEVRDSSVRHPTQARDLRRK